jgi:hypothetical protein
VDCFDNGTVSASPRGPVANSFLSGFGWLLAHPFASSKGNLYHHSEQFSISLVLSPVCEVNTFIKYFTLQGYVLRETNYTMSISIDMILR